MTVLPLDGSDIPTKDELIDAVVRNGIRDLLQHITQEQRDRFFKFYPMNVQAELKRDDQWIAYELIRQTIISNRRNTENGTA